MCWQRDAQSVQDLSYLMAWQSCGAAHELQTCQGTRVQCVCVSVCVKDGWRWNADHAGTLVWHGWESWHKNIAHCNSGYHVPVLTKHGDPQQPTQLHWEHLKGFSISTIVLNYVWSVCQGRGGTDTANFSSFLKKTKTIMFSYYKQTDQWGENKLWRPEAGISRGIWHLPFIEEQT